MPCELNGVHFDVPKTVCGIFSNSEVKNNYNENLSIIGRGDWLAVKVCWVLQVIPTSYQLNAVPYLLFKAVIDQRTFGSSKHTFF